MTKYVNDTAAGRSISAWIVMKGKRPIAKVQAAYTQSSCLVNVFHMSGDTPFQSGKATGYGYDRFHAALAGLTIDGHKMTDHCEGTKLPPKGGRWPHGSKAPRGWIFANYLPAEKGKPAGYMNCYREAGLAYLQAVGYTVIQAI